MTLHKINTSTNPRQPLYRQITALSGREYQLTFEFNSRNGCWYVSFADQDGRPLVNGLRLVEGWAINRGLAIEAMPNGPLFTIDLTGRHIPAALSDLGTRVEFLFSDSVPE